jgi:hypothetical protein
MEEVMDNIGLNTEKKNILKSLCGIIKAHINLNKVLLNERYGYEEQSKVFILDKDKSEEFINHTNHDDLEEIIESANKFDQNINKFKREV